MSQVSDKDVAAIKDWLAKEPTLPKDFEDNQLKKFIFSCHYSLERTKRCIEDFCIGRATTTEIFINRDPLSPRLQKGFDIANVSTYTAGVDEILIHRVTDPEIYDFYDDAKAFSLLSDHWLRLEKEVLPENHVVIFDIGLITLKMVAKTNIFVFQKYLIYLLDTQPVRLSQIHVINCPSYTQYMYDLVKGVVPQEIRDIVHFHTDHMALYNYIDKKYLPSEYGGDAGSMIDQSSYWINEIKNDRKFYLNDDLWKADISRKFKNGAVDTTMSGSFRTLAID